MKKRWQPPISSISLEVVKKKTLASERPEVEINVHEMPEKNYKPLDEITLAVTDEHGVKQYIAAIAECWAPRTAFTSYRSLVTANGQIKEGIELQAWCHNAERYLEDMMFLLDCPQNRFWSYMIYQKNALASVVTFLQHSIPAYIKTITKRISRPGDDITIAYQLYETILSVVLRIFCRLITNRESENEWLKKEHMSSLLYTNYLISVPMLFDLLVAVGDTNDQNVIVLQRIFDTVLTIEDSYHRDLVSALSYFRAAFRSIQTQAENEGFEGAGGGEPDETAESPYDDVAMYTLDCAYSMYMLLKVSAISRELCGEIKLGQSLAKFYDTTIPFLYKNIFLINGSAKSLVWLNQARLYFLNAFHSIAYNYVTSVLEKPETRLDSAEQYIAILTECLSEQTFVVDYQHAFPVEMDMEILQQACPDLDEFKATFILDGYQREADAMALSTMGYRASIKENEIPLVEDESENPENAVYHPKTPRSHTVASDNLLVTIVNGHDERNLDEEVLQVLDALPNLGTGFIRRVLIRYDSMDEALDAFLTDNLPPDLLHANQLEVYIPPDQQDQLLRETGVAHYNVHDGDEYDVLTRDKPNCIIKRGKGLPSSHRNAADLLDDKSDLAEIRHRYEEFTLCAEDDNEEDDDKDTIFPLRTAAYDDEYDDSYEAVLESESRVRKSKELRAGLANIIDDSEDSSDSLQGGDDNNKSEKNNRMNFCENPENVRARYEVKQQTKWFCRSGGRRPNQNVVGGPKGQGQDNETIRNRQKKEVNKSSRANHNRKAGAAYKRNKGMVP